MANTTNSLVNLHVIFFDVDGVFTDGKSWQDSGGEWRRSFSVRDTMGLRALRKAGYRVVVMTAAHSPEIKTHFERVGVDTFIDQCSDTPAAIEKTLQAYGLTSASAAFVTEDPSGHVSLSHAGLTRYTSSRLGGDGAILEISSLILQHTQQDTIATQVRTGEL